MRKKKYIIRIINREIIEFNHEARNKKEALRCAEEVVNESTILNHQEVQKDKKYDIVYEIIKVRKGKKNEKNC